MEFIGLFEAQIHYPASRENGDINGVMGKEKNADELHKDVNLQNNQRLPNGTSLLCSFVRKIPGYVFI